MASVPGPGQGWTTPGSPMTPAMLAAFPEVTQEPGFRQRFSRCLADRCRFSRCGETRRLYHRARLRPCPAGDARRHHRLRAESAWQAGPRWPVVEPARYGRPGAPQTTVVLDQHIRLAHDADGAGRPDPCSRLGRSRPFLCICRVSGGTWLSLGGEAALAVPVSSRFPVSVSTRAVRLMVGADGSGARARQLTGALT